LGSPAVVTDHLRYEEKAILTAAKRMDFPVQRLDARDLVLEIGREGRKETPFPLALMRCVSYYRGLHVAAALEGYGVKVVNSFYTSNISGNKLFTSVLLERHGVRAPRTVVAFTPEAAEKAAEKLGFPAVIKPVVGSWGRLIAPLKDPETAEAIFEDRTYMYPIYQIYYLQEYVKRPPRDIRCLVVGGRPIAAYYRYSPPGEWRTNIAAGGTSEECKLTPEIERVAVKAAKAVRGEVVGVDMMESEERGLLVHEVNHAPEFRGCVAATGVNVSEEVISYLSRCLKR